MRFIAQKVAHKGTVSQNPPTSDVSGQKRWDGFLQHSPGWSRCLIVVADFVSE